MSIGSDAYARAKWRTLSRDDWGFAYADDTLVRYVDFTDVRDCEELLDYVVGLTYPLDPVTDNKAIGGNWNLLFASYEKLPNGDEYRFKHALTNAGSSVGEAYVTENNCTFRVTITFYWRQTAMPTPVTAGTSGVTYTIGGVTRDTRTGLYSYYVEKREQLTTRIAEHKVGETDFDTTYEQTYLGVRETSSGSGVYTKDDTGAVIAGLWTVGVGTQGTRYTQSISKNANCTADVTQRKTVAKELDNAVVSYTQDVFTKKAGVTNRNKMTAAAATYVAVSGGKVTEERAERNGDGTFNNVKEERTEITEAKGVDAPAVQVLEESAEGTVTTLEHAGQVAAQALPAVPTEGTLVTVTNTKSLFGRFTQRIRTAVSSVWENRERRVSRTAYEKQTEYKTDALASTVIPTDPPAASGGTWYERIFTKRPDRKVDVREVMHEEATLNDYVEGSAGNAASGTSSTAFENTYHKTIVDDVPFAETQPPVAGVVQEVQNELTVGGKQRSTLIEREELKVDAAVKSVSVTAFEKRVTTINKGQPLAIEDADTAGTATTNKLTEFSRNEQTQDVVTPTYVSDAVRLRTGDLTEASDRRLHRNATAASAVVPGLSDKETADAKITTLRESVTDENRIDQEVTEEIPAAAWHQTFSVPMDSDRIAEMLVFRNQTKATLDALLLNYGTIGEVSASIAPNRWGLLDGTITMTKDSSVATARTPYTESFEFKRLGANGQTFTIAGTMKMGFNVSEGAQLYTAGNAYFNESSFDDLGNNWYRYVKVTSITPDS
jgi:hypothetical protein